MSVSLNGYVNSALSTKYLMLKKDNKRSGKNAAKSNEDKYTE